MGTQYMVACLDCGIYRDVDKRMGDAVTTPVNRKDAIAYSEQVAQEPFRYGLLVSFLLDHRLHKCAFFEEDFIGYGNYEGLEEEDIDFWSVEKDERKPKE